MLFKRVYDEKELKKYRAERERLTASWQEKFSAAGVPQELHESFAKQVVDRLITSPAVTGLEVQHTGTHAEQNFSTSLIGDFLQIGLAEIRNKQIIIHAQPEDLRYDIKRMPGRYCLHCGEKLADDADGRAARDHIALRHDGAASPDASNPAGYAAINHYETVLDAKQHERFKAQPNAAPVKKGGK